MIASASAAWVDEGRCRSTAVKKRRTRAISMNQLFFYWLFCTTYSSYFNVGKT
uniref:AlNc14C85G5477 protein n=1 Tax=Albugo laibachii Nc14 TaxID=890382 RepID=F0WFU2_9STRA|nr:AlNc14C85G5477 [Albugo laibachii Nc14]|eukprot:CCA20076.1 AlNc14C85G5477 [Albugo laibachii Nc14]